MTENYNYNTQRKKLVLPEYGRNIQKMVDYLNTLEDRDERNRAAKAIIAIMGNLNPHLRDVADFKHKLWDHLAIMSDFKLDIDSPYEAPVPEVLYEKPKSVPYNTNSIRFKHYGKIMENLIEKAVDYPEGEEREILIRLIANHMKKCFLTWNREVVEDVVILEDLKTLSKGRIIPDKNMKLNETRDILYKTKKRRNPKKK